MITTMSNEGEETLTYEPTSFVAQRPNVNPDSPRHFKSKRRRNNANPKLKRRPHSMIDFGAMNHKKEQSRDRVVYKRSKTLIERCRGALYRTISMDILLGSASPSEDDKSVEEGTNTLNFSKPITSRFKVQEIRKVNSGKSDRHYGKPSLTRSKSDAGCPSNTELPAERRSSRQCHSVLLKVRNCDYADENCFKNRAMFLNRENSVNSLERSITSSRNSSGFCDFTGTESEIDNLSSDESSVIASERSFQGNTSSSIDLSFDQDKQAEERLYPRGMETKRRSSSVERSSFGNGSHHTPISNVKSVPASLTYSAITDEVFNLNNTTDSIVEGCILEDSIVEDEILDDSIVSDYLDSIINDKYMENNTVDDTRNICTRQPRTQGISPKRINKNNIKEKCKQSRAKSLGNITFGRLRNNSVDSTSNQNNELKQENGDGISDSTNQVKPKNGYSTSEPSWKLKQKMEKNDITSGSVGNRRNISRKLSIEQCVEKLNLSNSRYGNNFSSLPRGNLSSKHGTSSLEDILSRRRTTITLPLSKEKNMFNFVPNIRIESVV